MRKIIFIVVLLVDVFLFGAKEYVESKNKQLDESINEKQVSIENNNSQIELFKSDIEDAKKENELVEKEYNVWVHQNEKLENILP